MALLFCDGFDHYATADILKKWTNRDAYTNTTITTGGRNGGKRLALNGLLSSVYYNFVSKTIAARQILICGFAFSVSILPTTILSTFAFRDVATDQVAFRLNSDGTLTATRAGTALGTTVNNISAGTVYFIEVKVYIHSTLGTVDIKVNGQSWLSLTNVNTQTTGNPTANVLILGNISAGTGNSAIAYYDDLYICDNQGGVNDDFLGDVRIEALLPTGAGDFSQWTPSAGNNYECVDEATPNNDTDYVNSSTVGDVDTYAMNNMTGLGQVLAVAVQPCARNDDAGARSITSVVRTGATNYDGANKALNTDYLYYQHIWDINPGTAAAWTPSEVNAIQAGVKVTA